MTRSDIDVRGSGEQLGLAHVAIAVGDQAAVDALAARVHRGGHRADSMARGVPATATTNAWCAIRKVIASKSRPG